MQASHLSAPTQIIRVGVEPNRVDLLTSLPELELEFESCWQKRKIVEIDGGFVPLIELENLPES